MASWSVTAWPFWPSDHYLDFWPSDHNSDDLAKKSRMVYTELIGMAAYWDRSYLISFFYHLLFTEALAVKLT